MPKLNCWEILICGRQPDGAKEHEMGVCPASVCAETDKINGGKNGGRACWAIAGTFCEGKVHGTYAMKCESCMDCKVYKLVDEEEGKDRVKTSDIICIINKSRHR